MRRIRLQEPAPQCIRIEIPRIDRSSLGPVRKHLKVSVTGRVKGRQSITGSRSWKRVKESEGCPAQSETEWTGGSPRENSLDLKRAWSVVVLWPKHSLLISSGEGWLLLLKLSHLASQVLWEASRRAKWKLVRHLSNFNTPSLFNLECAFGWELWH